MKQRTTSTQTLFADDTFAIDADEQPERKAPVHVGITFQLEVAAELHRRGVVVSFPYGDYAHYDLIADVNGRLFRVQVKKSQHKTWRDGMAMCNTYKFASASRGAVKRWVPYGRGETDVLITRASGVWYLFSDVHALPRLLHLYPRHQGVADESGGRERWDVLGFPAATE